MIHICDPYRQSIDIICLRHHSYYGQCIHDVAGWYLNSSGTYLCDRALYTNEAGQHCIARARVPGESFVRFLSVPSEILFLFVIFVTRGDLMGIAIVSAAVLLGLGLLET